MYRGRCQLGNEILLGVQAHDGSDTPVLPDLPPRMEIWDSTGTRVLYRDIPIIDRYAQTGLFAYRQFLNGLFSAGHYEVLYYWKTGSYYGLDYDTFDIVAGGDADGDIIAMTYYQRPHAGFLVQQSNSGKLFMGRNPKI